MHFGHLYVFLEKCLFRSSAHFLIGLLVFSILSCMYLYILHINPLLAALFANFFSNSIGCLFILLMVSYAVQELLSLVRTHWFVCFYFFCLGDWSKKLLPWFTSENVLLIFSSRSFMVPCLTFRTLAFWVYFWILVWESVLNSSSYR